MKIRTEINEIEIKNSRKDQWKQELLLWKDKIDKPWAKFIKKKRNKGQINKFKMKKEKLQWTWQK